MNSVEYAWDLARHWRRHRAVIHPRTVQFLYHWMRGTTVLPYPPLKLHLEPTSLCNLRCPMCPQSIGANKVNGFIDLGLYRQIIDQVKPYVLEVNLFFRGEPLMHRDLAEMLRIGKQAGLRVHVNTNATTLRDKQARALIGTGCDKVTISFDGADKETYEKMRVGAKFEITLQNVRNFLQLKQDLRSRSPYAVIQVILPWHEGENGRPQVPPAMRDLFRGLPVDEYAPIWAHAWAGTMLGNSVVQAEAYGPNYHPCNWLWKSMAIYWNGEVVSCCADFAGEQVVGDLKKQSVMDIWNGPAFVHLRELQVAGRYQEATLCSGCDALWQKDTPAWKAFSTAEQIVQLGAKQKPVRIRRENGLYVRPVGQPTAEAAHSGAAANRLSVPMGQ